MGTRHLICVFKDGGYRVAQYGQFDGYPEGHGLGVLDFLTKEMDKDLFLQKLNNVSFGTEEELHDQWQECGADNSGLVGFDVANLHEKIYPENSRNTGSRILSIIQNSTKTLLLDNSLAFAGDSLFCEWAYVIDFDKNTFEVYKGFNKSPVDECERFYGLNDGIECYSGDKYYPVKLVASFDLDNLPTVKEFLNKFKDDEEDVG
jgi:hypothetical protein